MTQRITQIRQEYAVILGNHDAWCAHPRAPSLSAGSCVAVLLRQFGLSVQQGVFTGLRTTRTLLILAIFVE